MWPDVHRVLKILAGKWDQTGDPAPGLSRGMLTSIQARIARTHRFPPWHDPLKLCIAEGFTPRWSPVPMCGGPSNEGSGRRATVWVPVDIAHPLFGVSVHHERAHAWIRELRAEEEVTDTGAWIVTAGIIWPPYLGTDPSPIELFHHVPEWFLRAAISMSERKVSLG